MALVVRKIEYGKWKQRDILNGESPSADAITNCMKTSDNNLSCWEIQNEAELDEAVVAIAACFHHIDTIDVLAIDRTMLDRHQLSVDPKPMPNPYTAFSDRHRDVSNLDYDALGRMADVIIESLRQNQCKRYRRKQLLDLLKKAVEDDKVNPDELNEDVKKYIVTD